MATAIKNDSSNLLAVGTQGALTIAGTAATWDASDDTDASFEYVQVQVLADDGAYVSFDGTAAAAGDFEVPNQFTALYSRGQFLKTSWLDIGANGTVVYQGMEA